MLYKNKKKSDDKGQHFSLIHHVPSWRDVEKAHRDDDDNVDDDETSFA